MGVFVYDKVEGKPRAMLHLWTNGAKPQFPVVNGTISQQEALTDSMRAWLALCWVASTGEREKRSDPDKTGKRRRDQTQTDYMESKTLVAAMLHSECDYLPSYFSFMLQGDERKQYLA